MKKNIFIILFLFILNKVYAFDTLARQAILMDYDTGEILYQKNANDRVYPSSMTKIMTAYIIFEKLESGRIFLSDKILISNNAFKQEGSRMFLNPNTNVSIDDLLKGLIVQSGNDSAYALAEGVAGTVYEFVKLMNEKAEKFNMQNTHFTNPIGYSDEGHYMSAKDTAIISRHLIKDFPNYYKTYFSIPEYRYNKITQQNRNELLTDYQGTDGIKTGHTELGGYSIAVSATRNNRRLISVVNGLVYKKDRAIESKNLLNYGFSNLTKYTFYKASEIIKSVPIMYGKKSTINLISKIDVSGTSKDKEDIKTDIKINNKIKAPITKDDKIGELIVTTPTDEIIFDLYSNEDVKKSNIFKMFFQSIFYFFKNLF